MRRGYGRDQTAGNRCALGDTLVLDALGLTIDAGETTTMKVGSDSQASNERPGALADRLPRHRQPGALKRITDAITAGRLSVPIAATFPIEQIRDAVILQSGGHVHGKVVVTL